MCKHRSYWEFCVLQSRDEEKTVTAPVGIQSAMRCDAQNFLVECSSTQEIEKLSCTLTLGNDSEFEQLLPKNRLHRP